MSCLKRMVLIMSEHTVIITEKSVLKVTVDAESAVEAEQKVKIMYSKSSILMDEGEYSAEFFCLRLTRDDVRVIAERLKLPVDEQSLDEYFTAVQERYFYESEADPTASWNLIVEYIITSL